MNCRELLGAGDLCSGQQITAGGPPSFPVHLAGLSLLFLLLEDLLYPQNKYVCFPSSTEVGSQPRLSSSEPLAGSTLSSWKPVLLFIHCSVLQHPCLPAALPSPNRSLLLPLPLSSERECLLVLSLIYGASIAIFKSNLVKRKKKKTKNPAPCGLPGLSLAVPSGRLQFPCFRHLFINHVSLSLSFF